jgi:selenocysteine-specific elongation factor
MAVLEAKQLLELPALSAQCNLPVTEVQPVIASLIQQGKIMETGQRERRLFLTIPGWDRLTQKVTATLQDYHHRFPARPGMPKMELRSRLKMRTHFSAVLPGLLNKGIVIENGTAIRLPTHHIQLNQAQQVEIDSFLQSLSQNPYTPPSDLIPNPDLLGLLIEQRRVVKVSDDVVFSASAYNEMLERVTAHLKANGRVTIAEVRNMFKTSRKYALAFLEHLDRARITRRVGDERVLQ